MTSILNNINGNCASFDRMQYRGEVWGREDKREKIYFGKIILDEWTDKLL